MLTGQPGTREILLAGNIVWCPRSVGFCIKPSKNLCHISVWENDPAVGSRSLGESWAYALNLRKHRLRLAEIAAGIKTVQKATNLI